MSTCLRSSKISVKKTRSPGEIEPVLAKEATDPVYFTARPRRSLFSITLLKKTPSYFAKLDSPLQTEIPVLSEPAKSFSLQRLFECVVQ